MNTLFAILALLISITLTLWGIVIVLFALNQYVIALMYLGVSGISALYVFAATIFIRRLLRGR